MRAVCMCMLMICVLAPCAFAQVDAHPWQVDLKGAWRFRAGDDERWAQPEFDDSTWELLRAPALWDGQGYADYDGFGWYRKWFYVPRELAGRDLLFEHGGVDDNDWVYINGTKVGEGRGCYIPRSYIIPARLIKFGAKNLIAVRIFDGGMGGGLARAPLRIRAVRLLDRVEVRDVHITGEIGNPQMVLHVALASKDGMRHSVELNVRIVDHFIRERLRERVTVDVPASGKVERTFAFKAGDSKDYRIHIELREGRTGDSLMRHLLTDVTIGMRPTIVLSGDWEMLLPGNDALTFPPEGNWERVQIPMRNYGGWRAKNHRAWFRKRFAIPKAFAGRHIIVRFEAVAHHAVVYVNGKRIGEHLGGFEPFEFDITHVAKIGAENELLVGVTDWLAGLVDGVKPPDDPEKLPNHCMLIPYGTRPHARRGIWDDVFLFVRDAVYIADVFVMPSVREGALAIAMALRNETDGNVRITVTNEVCDGDKRVLTFPKRTVRLRANDATEIRLVRVWRNPHLWFPFDPHLYRLRTRIEVNGRTVDEINTRFGFREFWIDGINYRLNGRIFKLRGLGCPPIGAGRDEIRKYFVERLSANFTLVRFHMMPRAKHYYEIADEVGMCVKDESAFYCAARIYALSDERLWRNLERHIRGMVLRSRNHPAVVLWSVENEILHCGGIGTPGTDERIFNLGRLIMRLDPTRPIEFEGDGDVVGRATTINIHYPREFGCHDHNLFPNDAYWLGKEGNDRWPRDLIWKRDKPLIIGEFCYYPYSRPPGGVSIFLGDSVYTSREVERKAHRIGVRMLCDGARRLGVAGLNPWVSDLRYSLECLKPIVATLNRYDKTFFARESVMREIAVHNDTLRHRKLRLIASVHAGRMVVARKEFPLDMEPGAMRIVKFSWRMPNVRQRTLASLQLEIRAGRRVVFREDHKLWIFPQRRITVPQRLKVALFDPNGETARALARLGIKLRMLTGSDLANLSRKRIDLLLIGKDATESEAFQCSVNELLGFVAIGGIAFCFEQTAQPKWLPIPLRIDARRSATMAYIRHPNHPLLHGMEYDDFKWWRADHIVAHSSFAKPVRGAFRIIVECGGKGGLRWTPLVEIIHGNGAFIMSQLALTSKLTIEPVAQLLLQNLFDYAVSFKPYKGRRTAIIARRDSPLLQLLDGVGIVYNNLTDEVATVEFDRYGLIIVDGRSLELCAKRFDDLRAFAKRGGIVWVHRPMNAELLRELVPQVTRIAKVRIRGAVAKLTDDDPLLASISNSDLFWYREDCWFRDWEGRGSGLIADPADGELHVGGDGAIPLTRPVTLAKVTVGKGMVVLDTLRIDDAPVEVHEKALRIASILLLNLGAQFRVRGMLASEPISFRTIRLSDYFNMRLRDDVEGDGRGGWTDQGENDMRNLPKGMQEFCGVPFRIEDGCIALNSPTHLPRAPVHVTIRMNVTCKWLFFLHAAAWCSDGVHVATVRIRYADGMVVNVPIVGGINITDWWRPDECPPSCEVAWTGSNPVHSPIGLYCFPWRNPYPKKPIATITIASAKVDAIYLLVALTAGM